MGRPIIEESISDDSDEDNSESAAEETKESDFLQIRKKRVSSEIKDFKKSDLKIQRGKLSPWPKNNVG